ncbi:MAG: DUF3152 domain-containing protein [Actinomycetes bacterium]
MRVPATGSGRFVRAETGPGVAGTRGRLVRYDVRVERGLRLDVDAQARFIQGVLADVRSWQGSGRWRFALVGSAAKADVHVFIATPGTTDRMCAPLRTFGEVSCQTDNRVVLNAKRWIRGADTHGRDLVGYRTYLVNHEFGHYLGYGHVGCPAPGRRAPVMMQQTKGLKGCRANRWRAPGRRG